MPPRQVWLFKFGCWAALVTAVVHFAGHVAGPTAPANDTERQLLDLMSTYRFRVPGGPDRSLMEFMNGFSLTFSILFAAIGALGLVVARRGQDDAQLMYATARTLAIANVVVLVISLTHFFIVPTMFVAAVTLCFAVSAVKAPGN